MTKLEKILERCTATVDAVAKKEIPNGMWKDCAGIAVINITEVGFVFSASEGDGVVLKRNKKDNTWGLPSAIKFSGVSAGFVLGKGHKQLVMFPMTEYIFSQLTANNKFQLGGEAGLAVGPIGRELQAGPDAGGHGADPVTFTYAMEDGLLLDCGVNGNMITAAEDENAAFYPGNPSVADIIDGKVSAPSSKALAAFHAKLAEVSKM